VIDMLHTLLVVADEVIEWRAATSSTLLGGAAVECLFAPSIGLGPWSSQGVKLAADALHGAKLVKRHRRLIA
jgi:hypothetical protein